MKKVWAALLVLAGVLFVSPALSLAADYKGVVGIDYSQDAGNTYYCASTGTVTTQAGVSVSSPTLSLYNPNGSGKNLVLLETALAVITTPTVNTQFSLAYNVTPSSGVQVDTNSLTNINRSTATFTLALVGKSTTTALSASIAKCNLQGYLPATPTLFRLLGAVGPNAITGLGIVDLTSGKVVIPPGGLVSIQSSAAVGLQAHFLWREDPQ